MEETCNKQCKCYAKFDIKIYYFSWFEDYATIKDQFRWQGPYWLKDYHNSWQISKIISEQKAFSNNTMIVENDTDI